MSAPQKEYVEITYTHGSPGVKKIATLQSCVAEVLLERGPLPVCRIAEEVGGCDADVRDALYRLRRRGLVFYSSAKVPGRGRDPRLWVAVRQDLEPFIKTKPTRLGAQQRK